MSNVAIRKVKVLQADVRQVLRRLLGRELKDEEEIAVMVRPGQPGRLQGILDTMASKADDIPATQMDGLIDEAIDAVRHQRR